MAQTANKDWEAFDAERIAKAVAEISASPNLHFFIRTLLHEAGVHYTPSGDNALKTAQACGRHSLGMDVVETLMAHEAELYPTLLVEDRREQLERGNEDG